jgi:predicted membrane protein
MPDSYQLGMGELVVDLRQTDLPSGDVPVKIDLGIGEARLIVPDDVCVATDAQVGIGEARTFDHHNDGVDVNVDDLPDAAPDTTRLLVKADVGIGSLRIGRSFSDSSFGNRGFDFGNQIDELGRNEACAT